MESMCPHKNPECWIRPHPLDISYVLEACRECGLIRNYNLETRTVSNIFTEYKFLDICTGPNNSLLAINKEGRVEQYVFGKFSSRLKFVRSIGITVKNA